MERKVIIQEHGGVFVPNGVCMRDFEIAQLFGIYAQVVKRMIRELLRTSVCRADYALGGRVEGSIIYPDYYGLDMIIAIAFRVQSPRAELFRQWVVCKCATANKQPILLQCNYAQTQPSKQN